MDNNDQRHLSEQLLLLHELQHPDLDIPYRGAPTLRNIQSPDTSRELRLLDTITIALTTGNPGDVFAAAFDKREQMQLVLAKNGPPTPEDVAAAKELISLIGNPAVTHALDIFPFLMDRCGANINKRIHNLHTSILDGQDNYFTSALEAYHPGTNITAEFPTAGALLEEYGDAVPPFATVWGDFVEKIIDKTAQGLNAGDVSALADKYTTIVLIADALAHSRFLKTLVGDLNLTKKDRKERAEKLKRRLDKVCEYIRDVTHLIRKAKRLFPIPHRWVTDTFTGMGQCVLNLCDNVDDALLRGLKLPLFTPAITYKLNNQFPSISSNWQTQQMVRPCIHAELRIILHLGPPSAIECPVQPIGVSKRCCFCCTLWIEAHNHIFQTRWLTSKSHDKPYVNWALPGAACSYDGMRSVDKSVLKGVSMRLTDTLDWLFLQKRPSDEFYSAGSDNTCDGEQELDWRKRMRKQATWVAIKNRKT
jgi:hypothetical protein